MLYRIMERKINTSLTDASLKLSFFMKTTKKHFELFRQECQKWIDELKLDNWEVHYIRKGIEYRLWHEAIFARDN